MLVSFCPKSNARSYCDFFCDVFFFGVSYLLISQTLRLALLGLGMYLASHETEISQSLYATVLFYGLAAGWSSA